MAGIPPWFGHLSCKLCHHPEDDHCYDAVLISSGFFIGFPTLIVNYLIFWYLYSDDMLGLDSQARERDVLNLAEEMEPWLSRRWAKRIASGWLVI